MITRSYHVNAQSNDIWSSASRDSYLEPSQLEQSEGVYNRVLSVHYELAPGIELEAKPAV